jgi:hypothetical protein
VGFVSWELQRAPQHGAGVVELTQTGVQRGEATVGRGGTEALQPHTSFGQPPLDAPEQREGVRVLEVPAAARRGCHNELGGGDDDGGGGGALGALGKLFG